MVLRYKNIHAFDNNKTMKIIYGMYRAGEVSVHRACCERATQPYSLGGGGTICPVSRPAGFTTRCPRMVTECLLTRSVLIKMYKFTISGYVPVYVHCIDSQSISYRRSLSLFSFFVWHDNSIRNHEYEKKEPFFSNRELLSTRKHWTINRHIAFISFQLKISTPFRKLSTKKIHCIQ